MPQLQKSVIVGLFMLIGVAAGVFAGDQDFTLYNETGIDIYSVYVTPSDSDTWGDNLLGSDPLYDGQSIDIAFSPTEDAQYWDLRAEDNHGNVVVWKHFDLLQVSDITLYLDKNGDPYAKTD